MGNKKLFVIDLDGTALKDYTQLHPQTKVGVKHLISLGHEVVIATGRSECSCERFYHELNLKTPLITSNGAVINNPNDISYEGWNLHVRQELIDYVLSPSFYDSVENFYYYCDGKIMVHKYHEMLIEKLRMTGCEVEVVDLADAKNINVIAVIVEQGQLENVRNSIKEKFPDQDFNSWDGNYHESFIEINPDNSNKWPAVQKVARDLNISEENIYTFGDANNDYWMIDKCQNGVAMKNATHRLKSVANIVLDKTNEEGAVGEFMLSFNK